MIFSRFFEVPASVSRSTLQNLQSRVTVAQKVVSGGRAGTEPDTRCPAERAHAGGSDADPPSSCATEVFLVRPLDLSPRPDRAHERTSTRAREPILFFPALPSLGHVFCHFHCVHRSRKSCTTVSSIIYCIQLCVELPTSESRVTADGPAHPAVRRPLASEPASAVSLPNLPSSQ